MSRGTTAHLSCFYRMSGKGAHINVLGERIRRYYEHLMADAHTFVDGLRKDLGPMAHAREHGREQQAAAPGARHHGPSPSPQGSPSSDRSPQDPSTAAPPLPGKRAH